MTDIVDRLVRAAGRVLGRKVHAVSRDEWESHVRAGGKPTRLAGPLTPFTGIQNRAPVVTYAMSTMPYANPGGFHVVRFDQGDAPNVFNTDSYDQIDLVTRPQWPKIRSVAGVEDTDMEWVQFKYVFLIGPKKRRDHHSARVPSDIENAKPK